MGIFLTAFAAILAMSHAYLFWRIGHYLNLSPSERRILAAILGGLALLALVSLPLTRALPHQAASLVAWIVFPWLGILLIAITVMAIADLTWLVIRWWPSPSLHDPERRRVVRLAVGWTALGSAGVLSGFAGWRGMRPVSVKSLSIVLDRLPASLDGLKLVQITDIHVGPMIHGPWLERVVKAVNALNPDVIAVTGDLVDGSVAELSSHVAPLAGLSAPLGTYFVSGNHEYFSDADAWCAHLTGLGLRVLRNERTTLRRSDSSDGVDLAGVDDWHSHRYPGHGADIAKALDGRDTSQAVILLAHQPAAIEEAALHGVDLQLSGHTHGGQIWPFNALVRLQQPYVEGLYRHTGSNTQIYVSPGTGFWGPPMRLGTTAEITLITLRRGS